MHIRDMVPACVSKHLPVLHVPESRDRLAARRSLSAAGRFLLPAVISALAGGCAGTVQAPVVNQGSHVRGQASVSSWHTPTASSQTPHGFFKVRQGDTLYSIAWNYGLDYHDLAAWNNIPKPYVIYPGQTLRLTPQPGAERRRGGERMKPQQHDSEAVAKSSTADVATEPAPIKWQWPTTGKLLDSDSPTSRNGVDIEGKVGQVIKAAASGDVVYSGSGLLGYGKLIIIKHNDTFLSAYAHNDRIYVKEGDRVVGGQKIATMGVGNNGEPVLHFEIRKKGKPVNPLDRLPKHRS
jgi:lipoprotein NlpD